MDCIVSHAVGLSVARLSRSRALRAAPFALTGAHVGQSGLTDPGERNANNPDEIERTIADFVRGSNGGLVVTLSAFTIAHRGLISTLAARHRLPSSSRGTPIPSASAQ